MGRLPAACPPPSPWQLELVGGGRGGHLCREEVSSLSITGIPYPSLDAALHSARVAHAQRGGPISPAAVA